MENDNVFTKVKQPHFEIEVRSGEYIRARSSLLRHSDFRTQTSSMENFSVTFEMMVNSFTDADELMNFAARWGIQDSPGVRFRLFQLRNPHYGNEELDIIQSKLFSMLLV